MEPTNLENINFKMWNNKIICRITIVLLNVSVAVLITWVHKRVQFSYFNFCTLYTFVHKNKDVLALDYKYLGVFLFECTTNLSFLKRFRPKLFFTLIDDVQRFGTKRSWSILRSHGRFWTKRWHKSLKNERTTVYPKANTYRILWVFNKRSLHDRKKILTNNSYKIL